MQYMYDNVHIMVYANLYLCLTKFAQIVTSQMSDFKMHVTQYMVIPSERAGFFAALNASDISRSEYSQCYPC